MAGENNNTVIEEYNQPVITYNHETASSDYFKNEAEAEANNYSAEMCVRYSEAAGDMTATDRLDEAQLKVFCTNFKSKLELENERLTALSDTFASANSNLNMKGNTYEAFLQQCAAYSAIINCMEMANLLDANEAGLLGAKLGSDYLDGSMFFRVVSTSFHLFSRIRGKRPFGRVNYSYYSN